MYELRVYFPEDASHRAVFYIERAVDVLTRIPDLLAEHEGCERVEVRSNGMKLFAVDCAGNTLP